MRGAEAGAVLTFEGRRDDSELLKAIQDGETPTGTGLTHCFWG